MSQSKNQFLTELRNLLNDRQQLTNPWQGKCIESAINKLKFFGADPWDFRGLSDSGIPNDWLLECLQFEISFNNYSKIVNYLEQFDNEEFCYDLTT